MSGPASEGEPTASLPDALDPVRDDLIEWYEADHRAFPWRETEEPYRILVSEVMSQQTQLDRVRRAFAAFVERWPTVDALASAERSAVVSFWSDHSLGYNNRARYLHEAAGQVLDDFDGEFPVEPDALTELQGVGPYTANAVASFAFNTGDAVVDTNVKRVLYRAFSSPDEDDAFADAASELMPVGESRVWNNAIMELGGTACTKSPECDAANCPWREHCDAYATGDFSAPDVPAQSAFEGSRRQFRGRIVRVLGTYDELSLDELGPRVRVDYTPGGVSAECGGSSDERSESDGDHGREWLRGLLADLDEDGLVSIDKHDGDTVARLRR